MGDDIRIAEHLMYTVRNAEGKYLMLSSDGQFGGWSDKCLHGCLTSSYKYAESEAKAWGGVVGTEKIKLRTLYY